MNNDDIRIEWEPDNLVSIDELTQKVKDISKDKGGATILGNGSILFVIKEDDDIASAKIALSEAKFFTDFKVLKLETGDYLVALHNALAVFVGNDEFIKRKKEIVDRLNELKFPSEELIRSPDSSDDDFLIGVYGRGKLQKDIYEFSFLKRV
jgi:hypothetical protein